MRRIVLLLLTCIVSYVMAEDRVIEIPQLRSDYPRFVRANECREGIEKLLGSEDGQVAFDQIRERIELYVERHQSDPEWILSRMQMYWESHATDIYVDADYYGYVDGRAPVPTVRYSGSRNTQTDYLVPEIEDIIPYQDSKGVYLQHKTTGEWGWIDISKTARIIENINFNIMTLAKEAAFLYWYEGDERYAKFAADIFDLYMTGIYYRNGMPKDLKNGHQGTLCGMTSYEVIQEKIIRPTTIAYDFLHGYLVDNKSYKMAIYDEALKRWADVTVANGVPHNNWNLLQAEYILYLTLVLKDDEAYDDLRGRQHYLNEILNRSSIRQWSIGRLIEYGFDEDVAIWEECPGYAIMVISHFSDFVEHMDDVTGINLIEEYPILVESMKQLPQYCFPNGIATSWGDSYYGAPKLDCFPRVIANAQKYGDRELEVSMTELYRALSPDLNTTASTIQPEVESFTKRIDAKVDMTIEAGSIYDYVTPTFHSYGVSWFVARSGMESDTSLMMSVCGSLGNHMHANGISMELYGKGYVQAADMGVGTNYLALNYHEFYAQFPAHNTVCVDGVSSYPIMKSQHGFDLVGAYPAPQQRDSLYNGVMYGEFYFVEPETQSDQQRMLAIINTEPESGYYVDVFRSRRRDGKDMMHDYFYHNIGQEFSLNVEAEMQPTEEISFAGAHLYGYSYLWDKHSVETDRDVEGRFAMKFDDGEDVGMSIYMRGEQDRKIFKALSPYLCAMTRTPMPYDVKSSPTLTYVARQYGEAWERPFVAIYEPNDSKGGSAIESVEHMDGDEVGVKVTKKSGRVDHIISTDCAERVVWDGITSEAHLAVVSDNQLFMSRGVALSAGDVSIVASEEATVTLENINGKWFYSSDVPCKVKIKNKTYKVKPSKVKEL